jgi:nucleotide-binding universal stress UspA family protein
MKLLVTLDGLPLAEAALPYAALFARANDASLILVRVVPPGRGEGEADATGDDGPGADADDDHRGLTSSERRAVSEAEHYLHRAAERLSREGLSVATAVALGDPAVAIAEEAAERGAGMIVMSTHGRSGLGRWLYGSVASRVMQEAAVPVLLVPPGCRWEPSAPTRATADPETAHRRSAESARSIPGALVDTAVGGSSAPPGANGPFPQLQQARLLQTRAHPGHFLGVEAGEGRGDHIGGDDAAQLQGALEAAQRRGRRSDAPRGTGVDDRE